MEYLKQPRANAEAASSEVRETVSTVIADVRRDGVDAVRRYSRQFDRWDPPSFRVSEDAVSRARQAAPANLTAAMQFAIDQVRGFARLQRATLTDFESETLPGVVLGQRHIPVQAVGSYSPGGRYPLIASPIMTIVPARVAGVGRIVACAPPRDSAGIHPPQLLAMAESGADEIYCIGGVQALAALAFGLPDEGLAAVDMIVGAGNAYVAEAKRQLFGTVGIDLLAGPTEILIVADEVADPHVVAADLLGQAEHGPTSPAILLTTSRSLADAIPAEIDWWLERLATADVAGAAWRDYGAIVLCADRQELVEVADRYAPEHIEIQTADPDWFLDNCTNYGSMFVGTAATVTFGDKGIGTNHVLPTGRASRYTGGLWVGKFLKTVTFQRVSEEGLRLVVPPTSAIAEAENMSGHAASARLRTERRRGAG